MRRSVAALVLAIIFSVPFLSTLSGRISLAQDTKAAAIVTDQSPAMGRARKQAKMLDTLYKTAIVLITKNYVDGKESLAAGDAFQALFTAMKENGFHEVRLLDATGQPYDDDNSPKNDYEKKAIKALLSGAKIYEEVVKEGDKTYLLSTTPIPVVMDKCVICHSHYEGNKGAIGALGLKLLVE
jgi:Protein of unknown function (DUF3365)